MQKVFDFLEKYMMGPMGKLSQKQFVRAIMAAGMGTIPFTIIGSAFLIINVLPQVFPALEGIWAASFDKITNLYMTANTFTMGSLALYFNIIMGYELTQIKANEDNLNLSPITGAMLGMMAFLMTITEMVIVDGQYVFAEGDGYISGIAYGSFANRLGTSGIFTGILMATLAVWIYKTCVQRNWTIKLPEAVPAGVSRSFTALIPCAAIVFAVLILNGLIMMTGYDLFNIIAIPFSFVGKIADTWYGVLIINLLIHALWSVGIHGANIIGAFYSPFTLQNFQTNADIFTGKAEGAYTVFAGEFQNMYVVCGGSGATLGMCIWMAFCAKSEQLKALGVASLPSGIFNINEPIIFGVPIIYNPNLIIPYILAPTVAAEIAYFAIASGMFPPVIANVPWPTPGLLGAFIGTGGNFMGALLALICIVVAFLIYYPFLTKYDSQLAKEEAAAEAAQ